MDSEGHRWCFAVAEHVEWLGIWEVAGQKGLKSGWVWSVTKMRLSGNLD